MYPEAFPHHTACLGGDCQGITKRQRCKSLAFQSGSLLQLPPHQPLVKAEANSRVLASRPTSENVCCPYRSPAHVAAECLEDGHCVRRSSLFIFMSLSVNSHMWLEAATLHSAAWMAASAAHGPGTSSPPARPA